MANELQLGYKLVIHRCTEKLSFTILRSVIYNKDDIVKLHQSHM